MPPTPKHGDDEPVPGPLTVTEEEQAAADEGFREPIETTTAGEILDAGHGKIADAPPA